MGIHFSNGLGFLYVKEMDQPIAKVSYQLTETDPTKYTKKKWWGELYTNKEVKSVNEVGTHRIEFEDGRKGECVIWVNTEAKQGRSSHFYYHFNGRSKLSRDSRDRRRG